MRIAQLSLGLNCSLTGISLQSIELRMRIPRPFSLVLTRSLTNQGEPWRSGFQKGSPHQVIQPDSRQPKRIAQCAILLNPRSSA
jgi:hypothetical protein